MVETLAIRSMRSFLLSRQQKELVIGSLLGDAYLVKTTRGFAFRVNHGIVQREYVDWKYSIMNNLVNSPPRRSQSCYYFRTISHPYFQYLRKLFYDGKKKRLDKGLMGKYLNPFVLAVWIMDDGTKEGRQLRINSQNFSREEHECLQKLLLAKLRN